MKNYKNLLVLENDTEFQGLPHTMEKLLNQINLPYNVWYWFGQDAQQNTKDCIKRFADLSEDTLVVSYPSFIGYDNTFEGHLYFFNILKEQGIKLNLASHYYPNFFNYLVKKLYEWNRPENKEQRKYITLLKEALDFHTIYYIDHEYDYVNDFDLTKELKHITWESLEKYFFTTERNRGRISDKVKVKSTGEIYNVYGVYVDKENLNDTKITLRIPDDYNNSFKFDELEIVERVNLFTKPEVKITEVTPTKPEIKYTGRKIKIKDITAVGGVWSTLKKGDIVDEIDRSSLEDSDASRGVWVMGQGNVPCKILNERNAREYEIVE